MPDQAASGSRVSMNMQLCEQFPFQKTPNHFKGSKYGADIPYYEILGRSGWSMTRLSAKDQGKGKRNLLFTPNDIREYMASGAWLLTCCRREGLVRHLARKNPEQLGKESSASLIAPAGVKPGIYVCVNKYTHIYGYICIYLYITSACTRYPASQGHDSSSTGRQHVWHIPLLSLPNLCLHFI